MASLSMLIILLGFLVGALGGIWSPFSISDGVGWSWWWLVAVLFLIGLHRLMLQWVQQRSIHVALQCVLGCSALLVGFAHSQSALHHAMSMRMAQAKTVSAQVIVRQISDRDGSEWRQVVEVLGDDQISNQHEDQTPVRWLLSLPYNVTALDLARSAQMTPNSRWQVQVKLRPIHGQVAAGAFDLEGWLLGRGVSATGVLLSAKPLPMVADSHPQAVIEPFRWQIRQHLAGFESQSKGVLLGLLTGDRVWIDADTKALYQQVGISHLLAISGPHVLLVATVVVALFAALLNRWPRLYLRMERRRWLLPIFVLVVLAYALLAGWELPAQRTAWMACIVAGLVWWRRRWPTVHVLALTAVIVVLIDPLALLSVAFWLSFGAVWILLQLAREPVQQGSEPLTWRQHVQGWFKAHVNLQIKITILLMPLVLAFFGQFSLLSIPVNLIAIPLLGVVVVGLDMFALLCWMIWPSLGDWLWSVDLWVLDGFHACLRGLVAWLPAIMVSWRLSLVGLLAGSVMVLIMLAPRGVMPRWLLPFLAIPLFWPVRLDAPLTVQVLDVGQGLSVLVQTRQHALLFDTGAKRPSQREGMAERVVLPALQSRGVYRLDALVVSHADNDHAGGVPAVINALQVDRLYGSQPIANLPTAYAPPMQPCRAGTRWVWDEVQFEMLAPWPDEVQGLSDNDGSCVLKISAPADARGRRASVLLTGDAGLLTEQMLLLLCQDVQSDVLVLGHHGSKTSSGLDFLQAVAPTRAVVSAGFMNRYGHPAPVVMQRLKQGGIAVDSTIASGTLTYGLGREDGVIQVDHLRQTRAWWH